MSGKVDEEMDVVAAIIEKDGRILITRRKEGSFMAGRWEFPGGKIEAGETSEQALEREIREELAVEIAVGVLFHAGKYINPVGQKKRLVRLMCYKSRIISGKIECIGCSEYKWVLSRELAGYDFVDGDVEVVKKLMA